MNYSAVLADIGPYPMRRTEIYPQENYLKLKFIEPKTISSKTPAVLRVTAEV